MSEQELYVVCTATGSQSGSPEAKEVAEKGAATMNAMAKTLKVTADYTIRPATEDEIKKTKK